MSMASKARKSLTAARDLLDPGSIITMYSVYP